MSNQLPDDIEILKDKVRELHSRNSFLEKENAILREQVSFFKALKFAPKNEAVPREQLALFNELEQVVTGEHPEEKLHIEGHERSKHGHGGRQHLPDNLPREEVIIDLEDAEKICRFDGHNLKCIGEEVSEKLDIEPAKIKVIREIRKKYACPCCDQSLKTPVVRPNLFGKSIATPGLVAFIAVSKYEDGIPLYRMENVLTRCRVQNCAAE